MFWLMNKKIIFGFALLSGVQIVISEIPFLDWLEIRNSNNIWCELSRTSSCTQIRSNIIELICVFQGGFFAEDEDLETRSYFPPSDNPFRDTGKEVSLL